MYHIKGSPQLWTIHLAIIQSYDWSLHFQALQYPCRHMIVIQTLAFTRVAASHGHVIAICDVPAGF